MTYRILQLHGGAMEVRSNADADSVSRGSTFTLRVPLAGEGRKPAAAGTSIAAGAGVSTKGIEERA
jgi:hypothetical protein